MSPSTMVDSTQLLECAVATARTAGTHALDNIERRTEVFKLSAHDIKLKLDLECQAKAEEVIRARYPDHAILGEEDQAASTAELREDQVQWIIDPIDGTVNFSHGLPIWCTSIAATIGGKTVAGAVYAPAMDELYTASTDTESQCNGAPIHVSDVKTLDRALISTGTDYNDEVNLAPLEIITEMTLRTQKTRVWGSAAIDLCYAACGRTDGYFEIGIYIWDVAAAGLIVEKAGGKARQLRSFDNGRLSFVAANANIFDELSDVVTPFVERA